MQVLSVTDIARVCHEANRPIQVMTGEEVNPPWEELDEQMRLSVEAGVDGAIAGNSPRESHEAWCLFKRERGWVYGEVKDIDAKIHPCLVDYDDLPPEQKLKDSVFLAIVNALT